MVYQCPHCKNTMQFKREWQGMQTECPFCQIKITLPYPEPAYQQQYRNPQNPYAKASVKQYESLEDLTVGQIILIYAAIVIPCINLIGLIVVNIFYYKWKKKYPIKANNTQLHTVIAFFIGYSPYMYGIIRLMLNSK